MTSQQMGARAARVRARLTDRDVAILGSLYDLRLLRSDHVQRLHVAEGSPLTRTRRTRDVLLRLHELRLVRRFPRMVGGPRFGSSSYVYGLTGLGLAVLAADGRHGARRRTEWETRPSFADHVLAVAEVAVQLTERTRDGSADLLTFDAEPAAWRHFTGPAGGAVVLKPDGYVRVGVGEIERSAFIEMDMGTERAPTLTRKLQSFVDYWRTGIEQQLHGVFPQVTWLVPNENRINKLMEVVHRMTNDTQQLFNIALQRDGAAILTAPAGEGV